jgi:hypothetical protein
VHTYLSGCPGPLGRHLVDVRIIIIIIVELWFSRRQGPFFWRGCSAWWCWRRLWILDRNMCDLLPSSGLCGSNFKYIGLGSWGSDLWHIVYEKKGGTMRVTEWSQLTPLNSMKVHVLESCGGMTPESVACIGHEARQASKTWPPWGSYQQNPVHSFHDAHASDSTAIWLCWCLDTWDVIETCVRHIRCLPCLRHKGQHACKYIHGQHIHSTICRCRKAPGLARLMSWYLECSGQWLKHASATFPSLLCLRHKGQPVCKYIHSLHIYSTTCMCRIALMRG